MALLKFLLWLTRSEYRSFALQQIGECTMLIEPSVLDEIARSEVFNGEQCTILRSRFCI